MEPSQFTFFWDYTSDRADADALIGLLGGFILHCYINVSNSTTELYSHVHFVNGDERLLGQFSTSLTQYVTCASQISSYMCDVRAFNEVGAGPRSAPITLYLGCSSESKTVNRSSKHTHKCQPCPLAPDLYSIPLAPNLYSMYAHFSAFLNWDGPGNKATHDDVIMNIIAWFFVLL